MDGGHIQWEGFKFFTMASTHTPEGQVAVNSALMNDTALL
jgi:hypothetical protein